LKRGDALVGEYTTSQKRKNCLGEKGGPRRDSRGTRKQGGGLCGMRLEQRNKRRLDEVLNKEKRKVSRSPSFEKPQGLRRVSVVKIRTAMPSGRKF